MKRIGETKIGKLTPKPHLTYPLIRLPPEFAEIIGKKAQIFETEYDENRAFLIVVAEGVIKPDDVEKRISELEKQVRELKEAFSKIRPMEGDSFDLINMRRPGFEPGARARQALVLPDYTTGAFVVWDRSLFFALITLLYSLL